MKKLKQALSLSLALVLSLALAVPAFAESVTMESPFLSTAKVTISDVESREGVVGVTRAYAVLTAKTGATLTIADNTGCTIREAYINGKVYEFINDGKTFNIGAADGTPFVLTDAHIGLWFVADGSTNNGFFLNVIAGGSPVTPAQPEVKAANPTNDKLEVNGTAADPTVYKIGGSNYFKIRDVAAVLNGTEKQFAVGYSGGKVTVTSGQPYEATGKELEGAPDSSREASPSNDAIVIDGAETSLTVYKIGGSNYFKLRDLGEALNFYVGWEAGRGVHIETDRPYSK